MSDELTNWIKQQTKLLYPDFYDDNSADMVNGLIGTANDFIGNRSQSLINKDKRMYSNIMLYLVLTLMWNLDHAEGTPTAAKAGTVDIELTNTNNPFSGTLGMFLELIGWNTWKVRIF